jgi:hypothetical protein
MASRLPAGLHPLADWHYACCCMSTGAGKRYLPAQAKEFDRWVLSSLKTWQKSLLLLVSMRGLIRISEPANCDAHVKLFREMERRRRRENAPQQSRYQTTGVVAVAARKHRMKNVYRKQ